MIEIIILYFVVGLFVCMVAYGDSLGAFPLWIWPIWPLALFLPVWRIDRWITNKEEA